MGRAWLGLLGLFTLGGPAACSSARTLPGAGGVGGVSGGSGGTGASGASEASRTAAPLRPICGGTQSAGAAPSCAHANELTLTNPTSRNPNGGALRAGDGVTLGVALTNASGQSFPYPCVGFAADGPGLVFSGQNPVFTGGYAMRPGETTTVEINGQLSASIAAGTVVHVTAWVDSLHAGCTSGATISWAINL